MDDCWYYSHDESRLGPYSARQMRALASSGGILPTDTVYKEGVERGILASKVKNLFAAPAPDHLVVSAKAHTELMPAAVPDLLPLEPKAETIEVAATELAAPPVTVKKPPERPSPGPDRQAQHQRKGRATAGKGITIVGQDGVNVRFRKKCTTCQHEDYATNSMAIRNGMMNANFYCPKCRKSRSVEMHGSLN